MSPEELSMLLEAAREDFEVKNGQPTDAYLFKIRSVIASILLLAPYDEEHGNHNLVGLVWSTRKYKATHQGNMAFHISTRPAIYDPTITDDDKPAVVRKKYITWKARVNDYKLYDKAKLKARALILHAVDETWVLELKDEETLFTQVAPRQLMDHLQSIYGGPHAIEVLALQNESQEYHTDSKGILEYINALEAAQKKSKHGTGNNPITDATLLLIATNAMLKTGAHAQTTDKWEVLDASAQTWDAYKCHTRPPT